MISRYYPRYWTKEMVKDAVVAKKITTDEYYDIVGEPYIV